MTKLTLDSAEKIIDAEIRIDSIESAGEAVAVIKGAARALWPDILFPGDPGFDDDEPAPRRGAQGTNSWPANWTPKPGSLAERILPDARAGKTTLQIADRHDITTQAAGAALTRLRRAGLLEAAG